MNTELHPILRACQAAGCTQAELAKRLKVSPSNVNQWVTNRRPIPIDKCYAIEKATDYQVMRWDLYPDKWHLIWPELRMHKRAPAFPVEQDPTPEAEQGV